MSTIEAPGIRLDLVGPRPRPRPHSLLSTPGVVVDRDGGRWLNGVNLIGYPDDLPSIWEPCSDGTYRVKGEGTDRPEAQFDPFAAYLPVTCSTFGYADLQEQAEAVLEASLSHAVEQVLVGGLLDTPANNPYFGDANLILVGGGAVSPEVGLRYLENAIGLTGRGGMIGAPPEIIAAWEFEALDEEGGLHTPNGTPVYSASGFIGADPDDEASPGAGESYAFASGPIEVYLGPMVSQSLATALDRSDNTVTFRAERYVLATWDTALQVAVLIDWTP
jgi:hypothetical protein